MIPTTAAPSDSSNYKVLPNINPTQISFKPAVFESVKGGKTKKYSRKNQNKKTNKSNQSNQNYRGGKSKKNKTNKRKTAKR